MEKIKSPKDDMTLLENRLDLMNQYNFAYGGEGVLTSEAQACFVNGQMTEVEVSSFVRFCRYLIATANNRRIL